MGSHSQLAFAVSGAQSIFYRPWRNGYLYPKSLNLDFLAGVLLLLIMFMASIYVCSDQVFLVKLISIAYLTTLTPHTVHQSDMCSIPIFNNRQFKYSSTVDTLTVTGFPDTAALTESTACSISDSQTSSSSSNRSIVLIESRSCAVFTLLFASLATISGANFILLNARDPWRSNPSPQNTHYPTMNISAQQTITAGICNKVNSDYPYHMKKPLLKLPKTMHTPAFSLMTYPAEPSSPSCFQFSHSSGSNC